MPVLTPETAAAFGSLILSDGNREVETVKSEDWTDGIYLVDFKPPIPVSENTWAQGADSEGRRRVRTRPVNPEGTGVWRIVGEDAGNFWDHADNLQELVASAHRRKGTIRYTAPNGTEITLDLESIELPEMPHDAARRRRIDVPFVFECQPYGRLEPVVIFTGTAVSTPVGTIEIDLSAIKSHVDLLAELTIHDGATQHSDFIEICLESEGEGYDPAAPSQVTHSDAELVITGYAGANATISGSVSTNCKRAVLTTTPVVICALTGPHIGRKKIRTRVYASANTVLVRLARKVGDGKIERSPWRTVPGAANFYDIALDVFPIREVPSGTHEWTGYIEAKTDVPGTTLAVDTVDVLPAEVYALARVKSVLATPLVFVARDEFEHAAGDLTGKVAPVGGTWAEAGEADGFTINTALNMVEKLVVNDGARHFALCGTTTYAATAVAAKLGLFTVAATGNVDIGLFARYVDTSNYLAAILTQNSSTDAGTLQVVKVVTGTPTALWSQTYPSSGNLELFDGTRRPFALTATAAGEWKLWRDLVGLGVYEVIASGHDAVLATSGALDDGRIGLTALIAPSSGAQVVTAADFAAWAPVFDHALHSGQSATLTHERYLRENGAGTGDGKLPIEGNYLRIPPATRAGLKSRMVIKRRRFDNDGGLVDLGTADTATADLVVEPRVLLSG